MTVHTELTPAEAADRLALRELLRRLRPLRRPPRRRGTKALFAEDTRFERYARPGAEAVARHVARTDPAARRRQPER
jgi:hypothetical protein